MESVTAVESVTIVLKLSNNDVNSAPITSSTLPPSGAGNEGATHALDAIVLTNAVSVF